MYTSWPSASSSVFVVKISLIDPMPTRQGKFGSRTGDLNGNSVPSCRDSEPCHARPCDFGPGIMILPAKKKIVVDTQKFKDSLCEELKSSN